MAILLARSIKLCTFLIPIVMDRYVDMTVAH